ncbi:MAG: peptidoglycan bridge formation glycyltransferase FemA/FemB family protein [Spirochaetales bacterium]|nr:peptidoglycan bridge formation glycyltransferase FemA/FemB family protein [Spirochaetales bacterium]
MHLTEISLPELYHTSGSSSLFQSAFWGKFKWNVGHEVRSFRVEFRGEYRNLIVVFRSFTGESCFGYVPYGPDVDLPEDSHGFFLEEIAENLRPQMPAGCVFLRFDLPWQSPYYNVYPAKTGGDDEVPDSRLRELRMNFGSAYRNLRKAPTDMQPVDTVLIDLSLPEDKLFRRFKQKTRYNIRLAERKGLRVNSAPVDSLSRWYDLYRLTTERKGIVTEDYSYFERLITTSRHWMPDIQLLQAFHGDTVVAGILAAFFKDRAYYLYGASDYSQRHLMAPQLLQWEAIRMAARRGCRWYDLFGIPPTGERHHPMHGLYRFKTSFGGRIYHWRGCWDYPLEPDRYDGSVLPAALLNQYHL